MCRPLSVLSFLLFAALPAQDPAAAVPSGPPALPELTKAMDRLTHGLRLDGTVLAVMRGPTDLHRSEHGNLGDESVIPIASASKWLAVATILTLVDDGTLDLDLPVARYLVEFDHPDREAITLRQCLSCTAGFPARIGRMRGWDSKRFVREVSRESLRFGPGEDFLYGGVTFQVAAAAAERATGKTFHQLFAERIAEPIGMEDTRFGTLFPMGGEPGTAKLPWVAGGAVSSLDDYAKFVRMLLEEGRVGDRRVLRPESIRAMFTDQVLNEVEVHTALLKGRVRYGLGTWIQDLPDGGRRVLDPGAFGFTPWIDLDLGVGAVFAVRDRVRRVLPRLAPLQTIVRKVAQSEKVAGIDRIIDLGHGGLARRYRLHVPAAAEKAGAVPLVLVLHDAGGTGERIAEETRFADLADREGFLVAFPDGTGPLRHRLLHWNIGLPTERKARRRADDVGFARAVVADIASRHVVDPRRIYVAGLGEGGTLCHRIAREASDVFAGIAAVAAPVGEIEPDTEGGAAPIGVLIVTGEENAAEAVPPGLLESYCHRNGVRFEPESEALDIDGAGRVDTFGRDSTGKAVWTPVRVITLSDAGMAWPGSAESARRRGERPVDFDATKAVWRFFQIARRPEVESKSPSVPR